jgi:hypothetical protein
LTTGGSGGESTQDSGADAGAAGGPAADGPVLGDSGCVASQKVCDGRCVVPEAKYGCDLVGCDPCPTPANSFAHCSGTQCTFSCLSGFVRMGDACVPGDGGITPSDGGTDGGSHCDLMQCPGCIPVVQVPCCKMNDTCGCMWVIGGACM